MRREDLKPNILYRLTVDGAASRTLCASSFKKGDIVRLKHDDSTNRPLFELVKSSNYRRDDAQFLHIQELELLVDVSKNLDLI